MIDLKPLKQEAVKLPEPLKSIIEMSKDSMPEQEFIDFTSPMARDWIRTKATS